MLFVSVWNGYKNNLFSTSKWWRDTTFAATILQYEIRPVCTTICVVYVCAYADEIIARRQRLRLNILEIFTIIYARESAFVHVSVRVRVCTRARVFMHIYKIFIIVFIAIVA